MGLATKDTVIKFTDYNVALLAVRAKAEEENKEIAFSTSIHCMMLQEKERLEKKDRWEMGYWDNL